jgi:hypothetical protein
MLRAEGEETNTNFIAFRLTRSRLEPMIYHTQGEHAGHLWKKDDGNCIWINVIKMKL